MASRVKGIVVEIGGDTTGLDKALKNTNNQINSTQSSLKDVERLLKLDPNNTTLLAQKQRLLSQAVSDTGDKLKVLQQAEKQVQEQFKKGDVSQDQYEALQREIVATKQKLGKLESEADNVASAIKGIDEKPIDEVAEAADNAEDALEDAGKQASGFGEHLKAELAAAGLTSIAETLKDVAEESKDHRRVMASLEVSSEKAGYSAEQTSEAYRKLYGILGDDQAAATTLANLQAIGLSQGDLLGLIDSTVGAWTQYGDSIPIDGLAEAINETVKTGQVTGTLADVLNWGTSESESFGLSLKSTVAAERELADAEEKAKALTEQYKKALKDAGGEETSYTKSLQERAEKAEENVERLQDELQVLNDWNKSVSESASAEDKFNLALEECSNEAERTNMIMQALANQGLADAGQAWQDTNQSLIESNQAQADMQEQTAKLGELVEPIFTKITNAVANALAWFNSLDSGTQSFILTIVGLIAVVAAIAPVVSALISVFNGLNAVMGFLAANPIVLIIAAIAALVAVFVTLWNKCEGFRNFWINLWEGIKSTAVSVWEFLSDKVFKPIGNAFTSLWNGIKSVLNGMFRGYEAYINGIISGVNFLIRAINKISFEVPDWVPGIGGKELGFNLPEIGTVSLPQLAKGGTVLRGSAIVGEAGPELLTVQPGRTIVQPLSSTTNHNSTSLGNVSIAVYGAPGQDENQLAELVMEKFQAIYTSKEVALV